MQQRAQGSPYQFHPLQLRRAHRREPTRLECLPGPGGCPSPRLGLACIVKPWLCQSAAQAAAPGQGGSGPGDRDGARCGCHRKGHRSSRETAAKGHLHSHRSWTQQGQQRAGAAGSDRYAAAKTKIDRLDHLTRSDIAGGIGAPPISDESPWPCHGGPRMAACRCEQRGAFVAHVVAAEDQG